MLTVVAGVIEHENRILIAQRKPADRLANLWEFPGGKVESGETPEQALVRELREEFEIVTEVLGYLGVNVHSYEHITVELLAYWVRYTGGDFALHDHQAICWVTSSELDDYEFAPADIPLVRLVQKHRQD